MLIHSVGQRNTGQLSPVLPSDRGLSTVWNNRTQVSYHLYYHLTEAFHSVEQQNTGQLSSVLPSDRGFPQCGTTEYKSVIICTTI